MTAAELAARIGGRSPGDIAAAIVHLIKAETLPVGTRLPTIRSLADELQISPGTVASAWSVLTESGTIETRGKLGTFVIGRRRTTHRLRSTTGPDVDQRYSLDLASALPDPELLPNLARALRAAAAAPAHNTYRAAPVLPELRERLDDLWPYRPEAMMATSGGFEALQLVCQAHLRFGDRVLVENPTAARVLDVVEHLGLQPVGVECDDRGPLAEAVTHAVRHAKPLALVLQPRAQEPTGSAIDDARVEELAIALRDEDVLIVEDDSKALLSQAPATSLGRYIPERTVTIQSYNKSHGLDLRVGALSGARRLIDPIWERRTLGAGWVSHVLQRALLFMLDDPESCAVVARARETYGQRREALAEALRQDGIQTSNRDGMTLWIPVREERAALISLHARGIAVSPGSRFVAKPLEQEHIRVAACSAPLGDDIVAAIASAARETSFVAGHV